MNLTLKRDHYRADGIFSTVTDPVSCTVMRTLEHAYGDAQQGFYPKLWPGTYTCKRSMHRLHGMDHDFETFEVLAVPGHKGILFHWGNFNRDSEGCILCGEDVFEGSPEWMVTASRLQFARFMALQDGVDEFLLEVIA
jgi:hypothetical protein